MTSWDYITISYWDGAYLVERYNGALVARGGLKGGGGDVAVLERER